MTCNRVQGVPRNVISDRVAKWQRHSVVIHKPFAANDLSIPEYFANPPKLGKEGKLLGRGTWSAVSIFKGVLLNSLLPFRLQPRLQRFQMLGIRSIISKRIDGKTGVWRRRLKSRGSQRLFVILD